MADETKSIHSDNEWAELKAKVEGGKDTCPNCGYCPHCGRRNALPYQPCPWYPWTTTPVYPYWLWYSNGTAFPLDAPQYTTFTVAGTGGTQCR